MNDSQPTLPKWPFYIGDALLVAIALVVAFRGGAPLNAAQMFWVIGGVGLGAVLFALPYIVEYKTRIALFSSERNENIWENTRLIGDAVEELRKLFAAYRTEREGSERNLAFLEGLSQRIDQRVTSLEQEMSRLPEALRSLHEARDQFRETENRSINEHLAELKAAAAALTETESSVVAEAAIREQLTRIEALLQPALSPAPADQPAPSTETTAPATDFVPGGSEQEPEAQPFYAEDLSTEENAEENDPAEETSDTEDYSEATEANAQDEASDIEDEEAVEEENMDDETQEQSESDESQASIEETEGDPQPEDIPESPAVKEVLLHPDLLDGTDSGRAKKVRAKAGQSVLEINALIGIGNKPYLRGIGPGLSKDKGTPMEFLEIGKWQWVAPSSDHPIRCQVYRNDETPAEGEEILIPAGQKVSLPIRFA